MSFDKLKEFIQLAKETGACELEYEANKEKYSVSFQSKAQPIVGHVPAPQSAPRAMSSSSTTKAESQDSGLVAVKSPFVGTFYKSPSPDEAAYVKVGDRVNKGDILCIVEAMKIMNEIESEVSGEVVEICVDNENYVEFEEALFKIRPS